MQANPIGNPSPEQQENSDGEKIDKYDPLRLWQTGTETAHDRGQGHTNHGTVHGGEKNPH